MDAREYLENYETLEYKIKLKEHDIKMLKGIAEGSTGASDGERVQSSGTKQKLEQAVVKYVDLEREIESLRHQQKLIVDKIEKLTGKQYYLIYRHYIQGASIKTARSELGINKTWATTTHQRALECMQKILDGEKAEV